MRDIYQELEATGAIRYLSPSSIHHNLVVNTSFYSDLMDAKFVGICEEDTPFGWLIPTLRVSPLTWKLIHAIDHTKIIPPYNEILMNYNRHWDDFSDLYKAQIDPTWWGTNLNGDYARRVPHTIGAALYINQCLMLSIENGLVPITDSLLHHRLLLQKYNRAITKQESEAYSTPTPETLAAEIYKHFVVAFDVFSLFLSDQDLDQRSFSELLAFKKNSQENLVLLRNRINALSSSIESHPWEPKFRVEVKRRIELELVPEIEKVAIDLKQVYRDMFGSVIGGFAEKIATLSTPTIITSLLANLSLDQILVLGSATFLTAAGLMLPEIVNARIKAKELQQNSLIYLMSFNRRSSLTKNIAIQSAKAQLGMFDLQHQLRHMTQLLGHGLTLKEDQSTIFGFYIPERQKLKSFPKELVEKVRKISKDSNESIQTRNDARSLLSFVDSELTLFGDSQLTSYELLDNAYDAQSFDWLINSLKFFRQMSFFEEEHDVSDKALAIEISVLHKQKVGGNIDPSYEFADFHVLRWDRERIWEGSTRLNEFYELNVAYTEIVSEWAKISRGFFNPRGVNCWENENGLITISITYNNKLHRIITSPIHDTDDRESHKLIDLGVLNQINELIIPTEYRYVSFQGNNGVTFLVFLSAREMQMLKVSRGWNFENNTQLS